MRALLVTALVGLTASAHAQSAESWGTPWSLQRAPFTTQGAVISGRMVFATATGNTPQRHIVALRLRDGAEVWRSTEATLPLSLARGKLLALREGSPAQLVMLDASSGRSVGTCTGTLPAMSNSESHSRASSVRALRQGRRLFLIHSQRTWYGGGAAPTPEQAAAARSSSTQVYEIRIGRGCEVVPSQLDPTPSGTFRFERRRDGDAWAFRVLGGRRPFVAARDDVGGGDVAASMDGRHVRSRVQNRSPNRGITYTFTYRDVRDGSVVAQYASPAVTMGAFLVSGRRIISVMGTMATVTDLRGNHLWSRPLVTTVPVVRRPPSRPPSAPPSAPPRP